jgi:hypothetical protein
MPSNFLYPVYSKGTVNFLEALAAAASSFTPPFVGSAMNNLAGVPPIGSRRFLIRSIMYLAMQNVGLEFDFWGSAAGLTANVDTDTFIARYQFASANGAQFNGAGLYRYYVDGLAIPYFDIDSANSLSSPTLHVSVQNTDTVAKSANAAGAIACTFMLEPNLGMQG